MEIINVAVALTESYTCNAANNISAVTDGLGIIQGSYEFKLILKDNTSGEKISIAGQITIEFRNSRLLVSNIYIPTR